MKNEFLHSFIPNKINTPFYISLAGITYPNQNYRICIEKRDITVIEYVIDGEGFVFSEGEYKKVVADTIYLLNKGEKHEYFADKNNPFTKIFLNISGPIAKELSSMYNIGNNHFFINKELKPVFERIPEVLRSYKSEEEIQIELQIILIEILTKLSYGFAKEKNSDEAIILKNHIDSNTNKIIHNSELAKLIFRSVDYCQKLFIKEFNVTPYEYQINQKIMIAKNLLTNTDMPIKAIGSSIGYDDPQYFANIFKLKTGSNPSKYRKSKS